MQIEKYKQELENEKDRCKLILQNLHSMEIREEDFKDFFLNESLFEDDVFFDELLSYEKELKIGETGN